MNETLEQLSKNTAMHGNDSSTDESTELIERKVYFCFENVDQNPLKLFPNL